jgi:hypothetical protein
MAGQNTRQLAMGPRDRREMPRASAPRIRRSSYRAKNAIMSGLMLLGDQEQTVCRRKVTVRPRVHATSITSVNQCR